MDLIVSDRCPFPDGSVRFARAEGAVLDNNIIYAKGNPVIDHWGDEYRFGSLGPVYSWKNTVMTNNTFYCKNKERQNISLICRRMNPSMRCTLTKISFTSKKVCKQKSLQSFG